MAFRDLSYSANSSLMTRREAASHCDPRSCRATGRRWSAPSITPNRGRGDRVSSSSPRADTNSSRAFSFEPRPGYNESPEGSPTHDMPKSRTALSRRFSTSRLPATTSPWNQTGAPCHERGQRSLPDFGRGLAVDLALQPFDSLPGLVVMDWKFSAPIEPHIEVRPIGELLGDESPDQFGIDPWSEFRVNWHPQNSRYMMCTPTLPSCGCAKARGTVPMTPKPKRLYSATAE
jgi:hypothetical protein